MTHIKFYVLGKSGTGSRDRLACRITEKALQQGHKVFIHTRSAQQSQTLDDLLWTFSDRSFLPHAIHSTDASQDEPVLLAHDTEPNTHHDVLINLGDEIPDYFSRFERVVEIVDHNETDKNTARERFRHYRERGYPLESHDIASA